MNRTKDLLNLLNDDDFLAAAELIVEITELGFIVKSECRTSAERTVSDGLQLLGLSQLREVRNAVQ